MDSPHIPRPDAPPPRKKGGILDAFDQIASLLVGRKVEEPRPPEPTPEPYIDKGSQAPPYPEPLPASPRRKQQEVFYLNLQPAGSGPTDSATVTLRTRCDFFTVYVWSNAAVVYEGIWAELGPNTFPIPAVGSNVPVAGPFFIPTNKAVNIHGAEQSLTLVNGNNNVMQVIVTANTNVPIPYY